MPLFRPGEIRTYIWRSAFFFCKDSIANESQLTIGEMYIRPYFYRSWRSFDERFFPVLFCFLCLLIVIICQSCFTLFDLWKKKERAREIRRTSKKFSHGSRVVFFSLELSTFLFHGLLTRVDSLFLFFSSFEMRSFPLSLSGCIYFEHRRLTIQGIVITKRWYTRFCFVVQTDQRRSTNVAIVLYRTNSNYIVWEVQ